MLELPASHGLRRCACSPQPLPGTVHSSYIPSSVRQADVRDLGLTSHCKLSDSSTPEAVMAANQGDLDMEAFQRLSDTYQPDVEGPLIRRRCPIQALLNEFSNADQTYVAKTAALAAAYSEYRPVKGDGQCGWRAAVFGYFESLLAQPLAKLVEERARLQAFNDSLVAVGYDSSMVDLFVDETVDLFKTLQSAVHAGDRADQKLLDTFNDEIRSNSIVFHFRLMTSATMKMHPDQYQPYLVQPLQEYCQSNVDAFGQEIEQISLQALTDGVIAPASINVVVMYLDRSQGDEVTPHHLVANATPDWPNVTLLYRPGHYDMIYRAGPIQAHRLQVAPQQAHFAEPTAFDKTDAEIQILGQFSEQRSLFRQDSLPTYPGPSGPTNMYDNLNLPYVTAAGTSQNHMHTTTEFTPRTACDVPCGSAALRETILVAANERSGEPDQNDFYSPLASNATASAHAFHPPMVVPYTQGPRTYAPSPFASCLSPMQAAAGKQELQIRLSQPCFDLGRKSHEVPPLETGPFKNSPFNRSHFANPDFQPMLWNAEQDYV